MIHIKYSGLQLSSLIILRVLVGWHFLYEGIVKIINPDWTAAGYLLDSGGFMAGFFKTLASSPTMVNSIDFLNEWGLVAIGLGLITGCLTRVALLSGVALLGFYFLSHPPFVGVKYSVPSEGSYLWVNKNLIEIAALIVLYLFPTERIYGIDRLLFGKNSSNG
jgi:thiosulfate dehydrogenase (quinone) large subunit